MFTALRFFWLNFSGFTRYLYRSRELVWIENMKKIENTTAFL